MALDHECKIQAANGDPDKAAQAVNFLVSGDAGLMTGAIVSFDQSVRSAVAAGMPVPDGPTRLSQALAPEVFRLASTHFSSLASARLGVLIWGQTR